jgi:putative transposon-encoded protein
MNRLTVTDIECFLIKKVTKFGTGAKVDCPKKYLNKTVYLVVLKNGSYASDEKGTRTRKRKLRT